MQYTSHSTLIHMTRSIDKFTRQHITSIGDRPLTDSIGLTHFERITNASSDDMGIIERPLVPLRGQVIFPDLVMPVSLETGASLNAARIAYEQQQTAIAVAFPSHTVDIPTAGDLFDFGTEIAIGQLPEQIERHDSILVQGRRRVEIIEIIQSEPFMIARARLLAEPHHDDETGVLMQTVAGLFQQTIELNDTLPDEVVAYALSVDHPGWLADFIASTLSLSLEERQKNLATVDINARLRLVADLLQRELNVLELKDEIAGQAQHEIARNQREIYLREQMRAIQVELGEEDVFQQEMGELHEQILAADLPEPIYERAMKELSRLALIPPMAPEVGIIRSYLDWLLSVPWNQHSDDNLDIKRAQQTLDHDHHGLPKVKERILEYIAVRKLAADKMRSPILCFVGPPGVGKTSLGKSIASALNREFVRVSLGGVRDEAEIRGHRRTYIGAMPGRILQTMRRAGTVNPVFMLDEIDKLGADFRGDPSDALLEVLDPEQNHSFSDHYLEADYDLSKVLFIATANDLSPLPAALLDRLEIVEFPGYTEEDKIEIARRYLIPRQLEENGIKDSRMHFETAALTTIIREYTYEAGVRNLDREIANVCRKIARLHAEGKRHPHRITREHVERYLGPPQHIPLYANQEDSVGIATGLAWTSGGGDVMTIEVSILPGKGNITLTGQLGEIMQESAQAAFSYMRSRADDMDVPHEDFENTDIHIHLPEGAVPKDGPSAGITLAAAIISAFTERKICSDWAMTGEITLRGRVLPVGGIKEKLLAAHRARIQNVIVPAQNRKDMIELPARALKSLNIEFVDDMQQVIDLVLHEESPTPPEVEHTEDTS